MLTPPPSTRRTPSGMASLESLVATVLLSIGLAALLSLEYRAIRLTSRTRERATKQLNAELWSRREIGTASCGLTLTHTGITLRTCTDSYGRRLIVMGQ